MIKKRVYFLLFLILTSNVHAQNSGDISVSETPDDSESSTVSEVPIEDAGEIVIDSPSDESLGNPIVDTESDSDSDSDSEIEDEASVAFFEEDDQEPGDGFILLFKPLHLRFGYRQDQGVVGALVGDPSYFDEPTNYTFDLDREYAFGLSGHFRAFPWMSVGLGLDFSFERTRMIADITKDDVTAATFYAIDYIDGSGTETQFLSEASDDGTYSKLKMAYGVIRAELSPTVSFFPFENANEDAKGFFVSVTPIVGIQIDSPTKTYLDILSSTEDTAGESLLSPVAYVTPAPTYDEDKNLIVVEEPAADEVIKDKIHEEANWKTIKDQIDEGEDALSGYFDFYGGIQLDIGWNGVFENGMVLNSSGGIGYDSSRGFYVQFKTSIGYLFDGRRK